MWPCRDKRGMKNGWTLEILLKILFFLFWKIIFNSKPLIKDSFKKTCCKKLTLSSAMYLSITLLKGLWVECLKHSYVIFKKKSQATLSDEQRRCKEELEKWPCYSTILNTLTALLPLNCHNLKISCVKSFTHMRLRISVVTTDSAAAAL